MCGLYGYITRKNVVLSPQQKEKRTNALIGLGLSMQNRGTDSAGIVGICNNDFCIVKKAMSFRQLANQKQFKSLMEKSPNVVLGHTRLGTVGAKIDRNAHPFKKGKIIGTHNGSVGNWKTLVEELQQPEIEVDSEVIFSQLEKHNNNYKEALKTLYGMFAIVWLSTDNPNKVYFVREDNPLFMVKIPEIGTYFWCSTFYELQTVIGSSFGIYNREIISIKKNCVYEIDENLNIKKNDASFKQWLYTETQACRIDTSDSRASSTEDDRRIRDLIGTELKEGEEAEIRAITERAGSSNLYTQVDMFNERELLQIMQQVSVDGCGFCTTPIDLDYDRGFYYNFTLGSVICRKCFPDLNDPMNTIWLDDDDYIDIETLYEERKFTTKFVIGQED